MAPGSKVRIVKLVFSPRTITGERRPQVGDTGIVLRVLSDHTGIIRYVIESMGRDSRRPDWTGEFTAEELELLPPC